MPSQKPATVAEGIKQILRDARVPESNVALAATEIQELYRDIPVPVALSRSMYKIGRRVFKFEFAKAFGAVGSPAGRSASIETDVSSDQIKYRGRRKKTHRDERKGNTYCENRWFGATGAHRNL